MVHLIVGLVLLILGAWGIIEWWEDFSELLRGLVPLSLVLVGLAAIGAGFKKPEGEREGEDVAVPRKSIQKNA
jgi:hypothetical protein